MSFDATISKVSGAIRQIAMDVDVWFDQPEEILRHLPSNGGWSIAQVLEHISLTNRFLLLTCEKHVRIALHRAGRGDRIPEGESDLEGMAAVGERGSFRWVRPEHMEPTGSPCLSEVRLALSGQWQQSQALLDALGRGEGALCHVTMTVNNLGKIDLYQWLYFVVLHARRHVQQMKAIEGEFNRAR